MNEEETTFNEPVERLISVVVKYYPEIEKELREALFKKWLGPAGGMWRSAMSSRKTSAMNCTTLDQPDDSLEGIAEGWYWWAKFAAYGQGEGVDLSKLRPRGSRVHNSAETSTGAVSFMHSFDAILDTIAQQGRRGASLISLNITHPDIMEFITVKDEDGVLETANISVHITDDFMEAVKNKEEWELFFETKYERISKKVDAAGLFDFICEHAWKSGDPGLQFIDTARKYSNSDYLGHPIISTNAPVTGDTLVPTNKGIFSIKELYDSQEKHNVIYNPIVTNSLDSLKAKNKIGIDSSKFVEASFNKYPNQQVIEVDLTGRDKIRCNKNHKWFTERGYVEAQDLLIGDKIISNVDGIDDILKNPVDIDSKSYKEGIVCGWLTGDGWFGNNYNNGLTEHKNIGFVFRKGYEKFLDVFNEVFYSITGSQINYARDRGTSSLIRTSSAPFVKYINETYGYNNNKYYVPALAFTDYNFATGFLRALFQTDGSIDRLVNKSKRVTLTSSDLETVINVQKLLGNWFGIKSSYTKRKTKGVKHTVKSTGENKISNFKDAYNLTISSTPQVYKFLNKIGFLYGDKKEIQNDWEQAKLEDRLDQDKTPKYHSYKVKGIIYTDVYEDMYCANIPEYHSLCVDGLVSSNCSEQFLDAHNVCLLSSINLAKFHEYGWDGYKKLIRLITYFLDAFRRYEIDEERSPSPIQRDKLVKLPRIGVGVTGLADYFIDNEIVYASKEAIEESKKLFGLLSGESYKASYEIAKKDGYSFEYYDKEKYKQSPFVQRLLKEGFIEDYHLDYQAHVCKTTVAPNGTLTEVMEAGGGGIEPIFAKYFTRRERATTDDWKEWDIYNHAVRRAMDREGLEHTRENAEKVTQDKWWITAHEVDNINKINMMSAIQEYIDSAISVTYNLPEEATVQDIKDIYFHAWEKELKGVAVYREGSKTGILTTDKAKAKADGISTESAKKRPTVLPCDIYEMQVDKRRVIALVGLLEENPYEVFITEDPDGIISVRSAKEGNIEKVKTGRYDLIIHGKRSKYILEDISSIFDDEWGTLGRMVSMSLRHNVPLQFIVNQLNKTKKFGTFSKGMARVLKKYIKDGEKVASHGICPDCGIEMVYKEGCISCLSCGYSVCD